MEDKTKQWKDLEGYFATEVIEQSKRTAKRWFAIWLITFIALVATIQCGYMCSTHMNTFSRTEAELTTITPTLMET